MKTEKCDECSSKVRFEGILFRGQKICDDCYYKKDIMERIADALLRLADMEGNEIVE